MVHTLDRQRLSEAFERLGEELAAAGAFIEIAVYGGTAIMLQFDWRQSTEDVDAIVREGDGDAILKPAAERVAASLGLDKDWLNNAVGMFTPLREDATLFALSGSFPASGSPGLRVVVARPQYLLAMKLKALGSLDRGERDMRDAKALAKHLGIDTTADLCRLYVSIQAEPPSGEVLLRLSAVVEQP